MASIGFRPIPIENRQDEVSTMVQRGLIEQKYYTRLIRNLSDELGFEFPDRLTVPCGMGLVRSIMPIEFLTNPVVVHGSTYNRDEITPIVTGAWGVLPGMQKGPNYVRAIIPINRIANTVLMKCESEDTLAFITYQENHVEDEGRRIEQILYDNGGESAKVIEIERGEDSYMDSPFNTDHAWCEYRNVTFIEYGKSLAVEGFVPVPIRDCSKQSILRSQRKLWKIFERKVKRAREQTHVHNKCFDKKAGIAQTLEETLSLLKRYGMDRKEELLVRLQQEHWYYSEITRYFAMMLGIPFSEVLNIPFGKGLAREMIPLDVRKEPGIADCEGYVLNEQCPIETGAKGWRLFGMRLGPLDCQVRFIIKIHPERGLQVLMMKQGDFWQFIENGLLTDCEGNRMGRGIRMHFPGSLIFAHSDERPYESLINVAENTNTTWFRYSSIYVRYLNKGEEKRFIDITYLDEGEERPLVIDEHSRLQWVDVTPQLFWKIPLHQRELVWEKFLQVLQPLGT